MSFHPRMLEDVLDGEAAPDAASWRRLDDVFADDGDGWLRFRIGVLRDAAYAGLPFRTRRRLHAVAGARLEAERETSAGERSAVLSLHFFLAGDHGRAWSYAREAGDRARAQGAHADAARLYRRAVDAARSAGVDPPAHAAAWVALGESYARTGRPEEAQAAFRRARRLVARRSRRRGRGAPAPDRARRPRRRRPARRAERPAGAAGAPGRRGPRRGRAARAGARRGGHDPPAPGPLRRRHPALRPGDRRGRGGRRGPRGRARVPPARLGLARRGPRRGGDALRPGARPL